MREKPQVHCFAALCYGQGHIFGDIRRVSLEVALLMKDSGYTIIGPDPSDMADLAEWEREQYGDRRNGYAN